MLPTRFSWIRWSKLKVVIRRWSTGIRGLSVREVLIPKMTSADPCGRMLIVFPPKIRSKASPRTLISGISPFMPASESSSTRSSQ